MVDYQAKYESLLRNVLSDLNSEVLTAQGRAEKNSEASGAYVSELKKQLEEREIERELEESRAAVVQLQEKEKQLVESRAAVLRLQEELSLTQSQLSDARCKLELYSERKNPSKPSRRENEQAIAADSTCMSGDCHVTGSAVLEFLGGLAGLTVSRCVRSSSNTVFTCEVTDGALRGHTFTLTLDSTENEFTYEPLQTSPSLPEKSILADTTCFPDYMQSRFLLNLLKTSFTPPDL